MSIKFKMPKAVEAQLRPVEVIAEQVMRPESRRLDDDEHARPDKFVHMIWPQMTEMERANLRGVAAAGSAEHERHEWHERNKRYAWRERDERREWRASRERQLTS